MPERHCKLTVLTILFCNLALWPVLTTDVPITNDQEGSSDRHIPDKQNNPTQVPVDPGGQSRNTDPSSAASVIEVKSNGDKRDHPDDPEKQIESSELTVNPIDDSRTATADLNPQTVTTVHISSHSDHVDLQGSQSSTVETGHSSGDPLPPSHTQELTDVPHATTTDSVAAHKEETPLSLSHSQESSSIDVEAVSATTEEELQSLTPPAYPEEPVGTQSLPDDQISGGKMYTEENNHPDPEDMAKSPEDFPSFTEWTQKILAEEAKHDSENEISTGSIVVTKQQKRKVNFASKECGSKILATNPEAENANRVLTAIKDDYMINPCKVKKWFIVELCEPIHVKAVEIASFELFSAQPKSFAVYLSDRYPTKDWRHVGTFTATEERVIQNFTIDEYHNFFSKFVKVDMLDHYGDEHFCPVTLFRVFGIPVEEDDYLETQNEEQDPDSDMDLLQAGDGEEVDMDMAKNLFTSAKDTVMKLVKKVLNVESDDQEGDTGNRAANDTEGNYTADGVMLPCVPEASIPGTVKENPPSSESEIQPQPPGATVNTVDTQTPEIHVIKPEVPDLTGSPIVRKLDDNEQVPSQPDEIDDSTVMMGNAETWNACLSCGTFVQSKPCTLLPSKHCAYIQLLYGCEIIQDIEMGSYHVSSSETEKAATDSTEMSTSGVLSSTVENDKEISGKTVIVSSVDQSLLEPSSPVKQDQTVSSSMEIAESSSPDASPVPGPSKSASPQEVDVPTMPSPSVTSVSTSDVHPTPSSTEQIKATTTAEASSTATHSSEQTPGGTGETNVGEPRETTSDIILEPSSTVIQPNNVQETTPVLSDSVTLTDAVFDLVDTILTPATSSDTLSQSPNFQMSLEKPELEVTSPVDPVTDGANSETVLPSVEVNKTELPAVPHVKDSGSQGKVESVPPTPEQKEVTYENPSQAANTTTKKDLDLVRVPVALATKRESAIMRLTNRIKALELNVSLSSRFLEELSQRYKNMSFEMTRSLNRTLAKLNNATKAADTRFMRQQAQMDVMESRLENLTAIVIQLSENLDSLSKQMIHGQVVWTSIEVAIFVIMCFVVLRRGKSSSLTPEIRQLIESMPNHPVPPASPRRNSVSGPVKQNPSIPGPLQKTSSETALASSNSEYMTMDPTGVSLLPGNIQAREGTKKKKKKKHKNLESKSSANIMRDHPPICEKKSGSQLSSAAGILFGTRSGQSTPENVSPSVSRSSSASGIQFEVTNVGSMDCNLHTVHSVGTCRGETEETSHRKARIMGKPPRPPSPLQNSHGVKVKSKCGGAQKSSTSGAFFIPPERKASLDSANKSLPSPSVEQIRAGHWQSLPDKSQKSQALHLPPATYNGHNSPATNGDLLESSLKENEAPCKPGGWRKLIGFR